MKNDVAILCELANVSRSGYYRWLTIADEPDSDHEDYLRVKAVFDKGKGKYGWRSIKMYLPDMNHNVPAGYESQENTADHAEVWP